MADLRTLFANYAEQKSSGSVLIELTQGIAADLYRSFGIRELRLLRPVLARTMERSGGQGGSTTADQQREIQYRLLKVRARGGGIPFTRLGMPRKLYAAEEADDPIPETLPPSETPQKISAKLTSLSEKSLSVLTERLQ